MACRSTFKGLMALALLAAACADLPRDNPLDPKNPDSQARRTILIEAFVNTNNAFDYNEVMLRAIDSLASRHSDVIFVQYHRNTRDATDPLHINESEFMYQKYLNALNSNLKGVPDVFVNGYTNRVQGATTVQAAYYRLNAICVEESRTAWFRPDISLQQQGNVLRPEITLYRLGDDSSGPVRVKALLIENLGTPYHKRVVRDAVRSDVIQDIDSGGHETVTLGALNMNGNGPFEMIIAVVSEDELQVHQCTEVML